MNLRRRSVAVAAAAAILVAGGAQLGRIGTPGGSRSLDAAGLPPVTLTPSASAPGGDSPLLAEPASYRAAAMRRTLRLAADAPRWARVSTPVGTPAASTEIEITVSLLGRDTAGLDRYAAALYTAGSPAYHDYLTPPQFDAAFGAEPARTAAARRWLAAAGLHVDYVAPAGTLLQARGRLARISRLFGVSFATFHADGRRFISAVGAPRVPAILGVRAVLGLDQFPYFRTLGGVPNPPLSESTVPADLWELYNQPANRIDAGQGQSLSSISWGDPNWGDGRNVTSDLRAYEAANHLPTMPFHIVQVGTPGTGTSGMDEWDLDVQAASSMAPLADSYTMYFATNSSTPYSAIQAWVDNPTGSLQASASFGECEAATAEGSTAAMDPILQQAAVEGRTLFVSSGDGGAGCDVAVNAGVNSPVIDPSYPASSPWVTSVGGTVVTANRHTSPLSEYAWTGSGGGISNFEPAPRWQHGVVPVAPPCELVEGESPNTGAVACRAVPDVAAQSGDLTSGYNIIVDGQPVTVLGTSLSAPLWQGMWARVQAAAPRNRAGQAVGLGFASPALYGLYRSPITDSAAPNPYTRSFFQITVGDNGPYPATPGWNYVTGLGTPNVTGLLETLDHVSPRALATGQVLTDPSGRAGAALTRACRTFPEMRAPAGSGANLVNGLTGPGANPAPADPDVSLVSGNFAYSLARSTLTATIRVRGLAANPQSDPGSIGDQFQALFTLDGTEYALIAARETVSSASVPTVSATPQKLFELALATPGNAPTVIDANLPGSFSERTNSVSIELPEAAFAHAVRAQHIAATTLAGSALTGLSVLSAYDYGQDYQQADQLVATCFYQAPGHARPLEASSVGLAGTANGTRGGGGPQACRAGQNQITGQPGQADSVAGETNTTPALSQEDLNVLAANLRWTGKALVGTIRVQNLSATPPNGLSSEEYFRYAFADAGSWWLIAQRTPTGTSFSVVSQSLNGSAAAATGSFDTKTNTVTITMPDASLVAIGGPKLARGDVLGAMSVLAQRYAGVLTLTADQRSASCVYVLP